jgi:hypothetical protein
MHSFDRAGRALASVYRFTRRWACLAALCAAVSSVAGCTSIPVTTDYDPSVAFSEFKSFAFLADPPQQVTDTRLHNALVEGRVRNAIVQQLSDRGFAQVAASEADFLVTHHVGLERGFDVRTVHSTHRYSRRGWSMSAGTQTTVREYERGTLLIDILLPAERNLVWRGSASTRLRSTSDPEKRQQRVNNAVKQILKRFPPS